MDYLVRRGEEQFGPYTLAELQEYANQAASCLLISPRAKVSRTGFRSRRSSAIFRRRWPCRSIRASLHRSQLCLCRRIFIGRSY